MLWPCVITLIPRKGQKEDLQKPEIAQTFPPRAILTNLFPHTMRVVAPLVVTGKHLLQHKHHTGHQSLALGITKLPLWETIL
jgi:hypothetical protein